MNALFQNTFWLVLALEMYVVEKDTSENRSGLKTKSVLCLSSHFQSIFITLTNVIDQLVELLFTSLSFGNVFLNLDRVWELRSGD